MKIDINRLKRPNDFSKPQDIFFRTILNYLKTYDKRIESIERTLSNKRGAWL